MSSNDVFTVSEVALPPVSRKFAHLPLWGGRASASTVFMASPAPLTNVPILAVSSSELSLTNTMPDLSASTSTAGSWDTSRRACISGCLLLDLNAASS